MAKRRRKRSAAPVRRRTHRAPATRRRRRRSSGGLGAGLSASFKPTLNGGVGGVGYTVLDTVMAGSSPVMKFGAGVLAAFGLGYFGYTMMGAGMAGAATAQYSKQLFGLSDELEEAEFTNEDLNDDDDLMQDEDGNVYEMGDDGEPVYLGNAFDLSGAFDLSDASGKQNVMMVPTFAN